MEDKIETISQDEEAEENQSLKIPLNQGEKLVTSFPFANVVTPLQPYHYFTSLVKPKNNKAIPTKGRQLFLFYLGFSHRFLKIISCLETEDTENTRVTEYTEYTEDTGNYDFSKYGYNDDEANIKVS